MKINLTDWTPVSSKLPDARPRRSELSESKLPYWKGYSAPVLISDGKFVAAAHWVAAGPNNKSGYYGEPPEPCWELTAAGSYADDSVPHFTPTHWRPIPGVSR